MGGIAEYGEALVCEATLDRAAATVLQERDDRQLQIFSFNLLDEHRPFTFGMPIDALVEQPLELLRRGLSAEGRRWAAYSAGCAFILHEQGYVDLEGPKVRGLSLALYSTVPSGAGVGSSAAMVVATMMNLRDHFHLTLDDPTLFASLCQQVEERFVGVSGGIKDPLASCCGQQGTLLRLVCQPHEMRPPLVLPPGVRIVGINSNVNPSLGKVAYAARPLRRVHGAQDHA